MYFIFLYSPFIKRFIDYSITFINYYYRRFIKYIKYYNYFIILPFIQDKTTYEKIILFRKVSSKWKSIKHSLLSKIDF